MERVTKAIAKVLCLCFLLMGIGLHVDAEEVSINKIAYVDTETKSLVLKFEAFSGEGYDCTVTDVEEGKKIFEKRLEAGGNVLTVNLGESYKENGRYQLELRGSEDKRMTVHYFAGNAIGGLRAEKGSDESLGAAWEVSDGSMYQEYRVVLTAGDDEMDIKAEAEAAPGTATEKHFAASGLSNHTYKIHVTGVKIINNVKYYGQGLVMDYDYVKEPGTVTGLVAKPRANAAKLSWNGAGNATSYTVYKCRKPDGNYIVAQTDVTGTSTVVTGLSAGKTWYFKVAAVSASGAKKLVGERSAEAQAQIPVVAGKVKKVTFTINPGKKLAIKWSRTPKADGYIIYYKRKGESDFQKLGKTKSTTYSLESLNPDQKYNIQVRAFTKVQKKKYVSSKVSKTLTIKPRKYINKNYNRLLANTVRTIGYSGSKCIYTTKKYSTEVKEAFVNARGYSSPNSYLIWISHYTQQVSIFKGKKGNWSMIKTFPCASGTAKNHSPIGVYKITYKEPGWYYNTTKNLYVTHFAGRNSFHTRPLWNSGAVQNPTIGKPASHGCIRCYNGDAKYIYDNMPSGTTVVSY
ncbi:MAG: fibronectin type III domain-containing protein [Eubacteriales bacterium]|nr:fibronectin type III domain-containing protein [Eubacteriales bacterium]